MRGSWIRELRLRAKPREEILQRRADFGSLRGNRCLARDVGLMSRLERGERRLRIFSTRIHGQALKNAARWESFFAVRYCL